MTAIQSNDGNREGRERFNFEITHFEGQRGDRDQLIRPP